MRLWSIHPQYLDAKGLVALWREGLLAQKVLKGETRGYRNHPQLERFKQKREPVIVIDQYLHAVYQESQRRGYNFNADKIGTLRTRARIVLNSEQLAYEREHLLNKLKTRDRSLYLVLNAIGEPEVHPIFRLVPGEIATWEISG